MILRKDEVAQRNGDILGYFLLRQIYCSHKKFNDTGAVFRTLIFFVTYKLAQ